MPVSVRGLPRKLVESIVESNGPDTSKWNQELRDMFDTSIEPELCSTPISGKVDKFLNPDFHYYWAFDRAERHERVEELRFAGWEFATTNDVKMCAESSVVARKKDKASKDGGDGFSDEIRSGDRRLMKLPMSIWRKHKKAQNLASWQQTYPQAFGESMTTDANGKPIPVGRAMDASSLIPGFKTELMDPAAIEETLRRANPSNSVVAQGTAKK
jgi:hypothetical protein